MKLNLKGQELEEETRWITELLIKSGAVAIPESEIKISDIAHRDFIAFLPDEISRGVAAVLVVIHGQKFPFRETANHGSRHKILY